MGQATPEFWIIFISHIVESKVETPCKAAVVRRLLFLCAFVGREAQDATMI